MTEYYNQIGKVPVGEVYESVKTDRGVINKGDLVVWSDPDSMSHNESVTDSLFIGFVEKVYKRPNGPELGLSCPLGRISIDRHLTAISGMQIYDYTDGHKCDMKFIDRFLNSDYEDYMNVEYTLSGDIRVSGE